MRLVSRITIARFKITLYFLAFTDEDPPTPLDSEANRAWLWSREFTQLELQHWHAFEPSVDTLTLNLTNTNTKKLLILILILILNLTLTLIP